MDTLMKGLLGRYEFVEGSSSKFWELSYNRDKGLYIAAWGRIGAKAQTTEYSRDEAFKKVQEKIGKGYRLAHPRPSPGGMRAKEHEVTASEPSVRKPKKAEAEDEHFDFIKELEKV